MKNLQLKLGWRDFRKNTSQTLWAGYYVANLYRKCQAKTQSIELIEQSIQINRDKTNFAQNGNFDQLSAFGICIGPRCQGSMRPMRLPKTPDRICDELGQPLFGRYRGIIPDGSLTHLSPNHQRRGLMRIRTEKCWQYLSLHDSRWIAGLALVRLGYAGAAFVYLFDRESLLPA